MSSRPAKAIAFASILIMGVLLRVWLSTLGHNFDVESYQIVADLVRDGHNVYAGTDRYNYGPLWFLLLWLIQLLQRHLGLTGIDAFHSLIAAFLALVDAALAIILRSRYGMAIGLIYFLCPVTILVTGFHSQFDNLALLIALLSWSLIADESSRQDERKVTLSAVLLGISLMTKHVMLLFPVWLLLWSGFGPVRRRLRHAIVAYAIFLLGFLPFALDPGAAAGIQQHVWGYGTQLHENAVFRDLFLNTTFLRHFTDILFPVPLADRLLGWIPLLSGIQFIWLLAMLAGGYIIAHSVRRHLFSYYLVALLVWIPAIADQHLAIPILACAVLWKYWQSWAYMLVASVLIIGSWFNIGGLPALGWFQLLVKESGLQYHHAQVWLFLLLCDVCFLALRQRMNGRLQSKAR